MLDSNTWNHLTVDKQMINIKVFINDRFAIEILDNYLLWAIKEIYFVKMK